MLLHEEVSENISSPMDDNSENIKTESQGEARRTATTHTSHQHMSGDLTEPMAGNTRSDAKFSAFMNSHE